MPEERLPIRDQFRQLAGAPPPETIPKVQQMFAAAHRATGYQAPSIVRDLSYGGDPRHRLDMHLSSDRPAVGLPVLLFVHGGGFSFGDKLLDDLPYHDHVGAWAVRHTMVGVTMNYRLAPRHGWPAGAEDVAAAVAWTREQVGELGGDVNRIVLVGHSAGATHVASFLAGHGGPGADRVAGAVLLSGIYDPTGAPPRAAPMFSPYFGPDESRYAERSAIPGLVQSALPMLFSVTEFDPPFVHQQAWRILGDRVSRDGRIPPFVWVPGHVHASDILSLGVDQDSVLEPALSLFIERVTTTSTA